jgi:uncharacterized membrane protein
MTNNTIILSYSYQTINGRRVSYNDLIKSGWAMLEWLILAIVLGVAVVIMVFLLLLRSSSNISVYGDESPKAVFADTDVEYEWNAGVHPLIKALIVILLIIAVVGVFLFLSGEDPEYSTLMKLLATGFGTLFSILAALRHTKTYKITTDGLYAFQRGGKNRVLVFTWRNLRWFKPDNKGFRYYLAADGSNNLFSSNTNLATGNYIYCGKHATLVNSIISGHGVPTSPPED